MAAIPTNPDPTSTNPGKNVAYDPANPFNAGVAGTGNFSGSNMPTTTTPTPMPPAVKNGIESTANGEGRSLSSVPSTNSSSIDYTLHNGESLDAYNARISAARGTEKNTDNGTGTSKPNINDFLNGLTPPTQPNMGQVQSDAESKNNISGIQGNLNDLNTQYQNIQNDIQNRQAGEASKPGVVSALINGRIRMISADDAKVLNDLKANISSTTRQLTQANTAVSTIMKNTQTDFNNAEKQYQDSYNDAIKAYTTQETQSNKEQTIAKANAQVIINSFKGSSGGFNSITADTKAQWSSLESQAGLPPGTIEAAVKAELNITKFVKGSDGNMYVTGTDANGVPYTAKIEGSQGSGSGSSQSPAAKLKADTSAMSGALDSAKGTDGMVSNADWNAALKDWISRGYTTAQFNSLFKSYKSTNKG